MEKLRDSQLPIDWTVSLFLVFTPLAAIALLPVHLASEGLSLSLISLFVVSAGITNLSITAGYHRLFAHQSYQATGWVRLAYLIFGAAAFQGSALRWCSDHRRHHKFVDTDQDPYNINRGFFYAHMGWLFLKDEGPVEFAADLNRDPWMLWQHRYFVPLAIGIGFGLPTLIGLAMGSPLGGLIYGGLVRVVVTQHSTFLINSWCHFFGKKTYGDRNSARDSVLASVLTHGEGYHNFHHHFEADYRNGVRWYDWDPTKWFIRLLTTFSLANGLRRVPESRILRAKLDAQSKVLATSGLSQDLIFSMRWRVEESQRRWAELKREYVELRSRLKAHSQMRRSQMSDQLEQLRASYEALREEMRAAKRDFRQAKRDWQLTWRAHAFA